MTPLTTKPMFRVGDCVIMPAFTNFNGRPIAAQHLCVTDVRNVNGAYWITALGHNGRGAAEGHEKHFVNDPIETAQCAADLREIAELSQ